MGHLGQFASVKEDDKKWKYISFYIPSLLVWPTPTFSFFHWCNKQVRQQNPPALLKKNNNKDINGSIESEINQKLTSRHVHLILNLTCPGEMKILSDFRGTCSILALNHYLHNVKQLILLQYHFQQETILFRIAQKYILYKLCRSLKKKKWRLGTYKSRTDKQSVLIIYFTLKIFTHF